MPRPKAAEPRDQPLLLRLTARQLEVLQSVAHLERTRPNTYVHQLLVQHLASMVKNPRVQADLANRAAYDGDSTAATRMRDRRATDLHRRQLHLRLSGDRRRASQTRRRCVSLTGRGPSRGRGPFLGCAVSHRAYEQGPPYPAAAPPGEPSRSRP
jgi:hypothetical protein